MSPIEPTPALLRRCLTLAAWLNFAELREWVGHELDGYPSREAAPAYRHIGEVQVVGDFAGAFRTSGRDKPIPPTAIPDYTREHEVLDHCLLDGVAGYEALLATGKTSFRSPWESDVVALMKRDGIPAYPDVVLVRAFGEIPADAIAGMLDAIRTRVLRFALDIETENLDDNAVGGHPVANERLRRIFNATIYGSGMTPADVPASYV